MLRHLPAALMPPAVVLAATALALRVPRLARAWLPLHDVFLGAAIGVGVLLAVQFNRARVVLGIAALASVDFALRSAGGPPDGLAGDTRTMLLTTLPLCLAALALLGERGLTTASGLARLVVAAVPMAALAVLARNPDSARAMSSATGLSSPAPWAVAFAAAALVARQAHRPSPIDAGFLGALAASGIALSPFLPAGLAHPWLTAGIAALALSVVQEGQRMAYLDELTGIPGRRAFNEYLLRLGRRYAIAVVDVDHFKRFNDTHGHDVGDRVLQMVASRLERVGGRGRAFRCGGEEFVLVFPGRSAAEVRPHVERVRIRIGETLVRLPGRPVRRTTRSLLGLSEPGHAVSVTISAGLAEPDPGRVGPEDVMKAADQALYKAKEAGRNRVWVDGPDHLPTSAPAPTTAAS